MNNVASFILNFLNRKGSYVFFATTFAKIASFLASIICLKLIDNNVLGVVLFAYTFIAFLIPMSGFGLNQSLIRYGAFLPEKNAKNNLFRYTFLKGTYINLAIITIVITTTYFIPFNFKNTYFYLCTLSLLLIPQYVFELLKSHFRLHHNNKKYAYAELVFNTVLLILVSVLSYTYHELGYILALILTPLISILCFYKSFTSALKAYKKPTFERKKFYSYGFFASLANTASMFLMMIDILLIGNLLKNAEMVTYYKYLSLIPISLIFIPSVVITTDFVSFTERINDKPYIHNYIKNYIKLFSMISLIIMIVSYLLADYILAFFGNDFTHYKSTFLILIFGITSILSLRTLFGNLLSSIGKAHVNYYVIAIALVINVVSNYYLIPKLKIEGAAITSAAMMWFTSIGSMLAFYHFYNKESDFSKT